MSQPGENQRVFEEGKVYNFKIHLLYFYFKTPTKQILAFSQKLGKILIWQNSSMVAKGCQTKKKIVLFCFDFCFIIIFFF